MAKPVHLDVLTDPVLHVFGYTATGKTHLVRNLLASASKVSEWNVVAIDQHGEYNGITGVAHVERNTDEGLHVAVDEQYRTLLSRLEGARWTKRILVGLDEQTVQRYVSSYHANNSAHVRASEQLQELFLRGREVGMYFIFVTHGDPNRPAIFRPASRAQLSKDGPVYSFAYTNVAGDRQSGRTYDPVGLSAHEVNRTR